MDMDLNHYIEKIVETIIGEINANVQSRIDGILHSAINSKLAEIDYTNHIQQAANSAFEKKAHEYTIDSKRLESKISGRINEVIAEAESNTKNLINEAVKNKVSGTNFQEALTSTVKTVISDRLLEFKFPDNSIPASSINFDKFQISGDNVSGGLITNFSSVGIDDRSTQVAVTILDEATVVENNLITKDLTIEGSMIVNGSFVVNGSVPEESTFYQNLVSSASESTVKKLDSTLFDGYSNLIFNRIRTEGLDLNKITLNNNEIINDNSLGPSVINSNLQRLGILKELQVSGESFIAESFYATKGRVGINTIEPSAPLAVWDDEIEVTVGKRQKETGSIGTPRNQRLVLFANNKDNISLETDGSTTINDLRIGPMRFTAADRPPNYVSERGHIVWNTNPNPGGPMGWVCLGAANWANFGIID